MIKMNISKKITLLFTALILLSISVSVFFPMQSFTKHVKQNAIRELEKSKKILNQNYENILNNIVHNLQITAGTSELRNAVFNKDQALSLNILNILKRRFNFQFIEIVLPDMQFIHSPGIPSDFLRKKDEDFLNKIFSSEKVSYIYESGDSNYVRFGQPLFPLQSNKVIAAVISGCLIDDQLMDRLKGLTGAEVIFIDNNYKVFSTLFTQQGSKRFRAIDHNRIAGLFKNITSTEKSIEMEIENNSYRFSFSPVYDKNERIFGFLGSGISMAFIKQAQKNVLIQAALISILAVFITGLIAFLFAGTISKPIKELSLGVEAAAAGYLDQEIPKRYNDEVGNLTITFNKTMQNLRRRHNKLEQTATHRTSELNRVNKILAQYTDNLERMVSKRTAQLRNKDEVLIQSGKLASLGEMATSIAHEINQPINVIKLIATGLLRQFSKNNVVETELLKNELKTINQQIVRLQKIIMHMKMFARKRVDINISPIEINKPISDSFLLIGQQLHAHSIEVDLQLKENLPLVKVEPTQLEQIIINLVHNARDALDEKELKLSDKDKQEFNKKITIKTYFHKRDVCIEFSDNGAGMSPETLDNIFEPFHTTKDSIKGTGLGMSISYNLIRNMYGDISVKSYPGEGSCFLIKIPAYKENIH
jgi:signal transduction histidine kinase